MSERAIWVYFHGSSCQRVYFDKDGKVSQVFVGGT